MSEFKVGDRVAHRKFPNWSSGTVRELLANGAVVQWDNGNRKEHHYLALCLISSPLETRSTSDSGAEKGVKPETDAVNHPAHYGGETTYEAIKVITAWGLGFDLGNVTKYVARAGKKDPTKELEDLRKARFYLDHRINQLEQK